MKLYISTQKRNDLKFNIYVHDNCIHTLPVSVYLFLYNQIIM